LKKYGDSRTFRKSKSPLSGRGGNISVGYDVWKLSSNCGQEELKSYNKVKGDKWDIFAFIYLTFLRKKKKKKIK
jgi:hypothetical protein